MNYILPNLVLFTVDLSEELCYNGCSTYARRLHYEITDTAYGVE